MKKAYNQQKLFVLSEKEDDPLEALARRAAQAMLQEALEEEAEEFLARRRYQRSGVEQFRGYRNGAAKERKISIGSGTIKVRVPRVSDVPPDQEPFESQLVKPYQKRSRTLEELFPKLFIEGLATRDFEPALRCLLGQDAPLSPSTISRLNAQFKADYEAWRKQKLEALQIVYLWADGVYLAAGVGDEKACLLVIVGVDTTGKKHFLALEEGYRESKESWLALLRDLKARGMNEPAVAIADGGLGFWAALPEVFGQTREQLCWLHKMRNVLDKLPRKERGEAAKSLRAIYLASDRVSAERLAKGLAARWSKNYTRAAECLLQALPRLLTFYDYPSEHARHLRTTNVIESVFASVRLRTNAAKRFRTARSGMHLVFKLLERCEQGWQRLSHPEKLKEVRLPQGRIEAQAAA